MSEIIELIHKYYNSNYLKEKMEMRTVLLKKKTEINLHNNFKIVVFTHYDSFKSSNIKGCLDTMVRLAH
jgi:hypothetical protein